MLMLCVFVFKILNLKIFLTHKVVMGISCSKAKGREIQVDSAILKFCR